MIFNINIIVPTYLKYFYLVGAVNISEKNIFIN